MPPSAQPANGAVEDPETLIAIGPLRALHWLEFLGALSLSLSLLASWKKLQVRVIFPIWACRSNWQDTGETEFSERELRSPLGLEELMRKVD